MGAGRIAFIEDNINLTSNFHLISGARAYGLSRHWLRCCMFLGHILPPSVSARYYRCKSLHRLAACSSRAEMQ